MCYERDASSGARSNVDARKHRGTIIGNLTRDTLIERYLERGESLQDIAKDLKCSRQYIHKLMASFGIDRRTRRDARIVATEKGKIAFEIVDAWGISREITQQRLTFDRAFFDTWSDGLAYILGMIYTDGNLLESYWNRRSSKRVEDYRISVYQKDPYILEQIRKMIGLNTTIKKMRNNKTDHLYKLEMRDKELFQKLLALGLCTNKSLRITFPQIPREYLGGFFRGLFDGDGSYSEGRARLVTGSLAFARGLKDALEAEGFGTSLYTTPASATRKNPAYTIAVSAKKEGLFRFYQSLYAKATIFIPGKRRQLEDTIARTLKRGTDRSWEGPGLVPKE